MGRIRGVSGVGLLVVLVLCSPMLFSVVYPVVATSDGGDAARSTPRECVTPPNRTAPSESAANVTATAALSGNGTVNITYDIDPETDAGTDLTILRTAEIEVVETNGFDRTQFGAFESWQTEASSGLRVNRSAESHWIQYRTIPIAVGESERDPYPRGEEWAIAPIPEHTDEAVVLEPAASGYVGSSTLYLGEFDRESTTVGCQTFEIVVPDETGSSFDADERLADLESAARTIPGQKYETVSVFVSPADLGDDDRIGGFVRDRTNEIVVAEDAGALPTSVVWIHEYVHTLQDYRPQPDLEWTIEGVATYAALDAAVDTGRITPLEYDLALSRLNRVDSGRSLTNASSELTPYSRGAVVLARIDADLEAHSEKTIYDVVAWLNDRSEPGYADLKGYLEEEAGLPAETVDSYDRLVLGDDPVAVEYRHAPTELSPVGWTAVSFLLSDAFRAFSAVALTGVSVTLVVSGLYARLKLDPDEIDF